MLSPAVRFVATKGLKTPAGSIQLLCRVKPGVSANREGVSAIADGFVEVCVAARAKEGEANEAVIHVIAKASNCSEICRCRVPNNREALKVPKSDVDIVKGLKSREKTVLIGNIKIDGTPEDYIERLRTTLRMRASA